MLTKHLQRKMLFLVTNLISSFAIAPNNKTALVFNAINHRKAKDLLQMKTSKKLAINSNGNKMIKKKTKQKTLNNQKM